jgi:hypothetical protein
MQESTGKNKFLFFLPLLAWLVVNLLQAAFTGISDDEAYYWVYANNLDFGYFDHPPAIAVMIKAGFALFDNELGTRLFTVLLSTASVYLLFKLAGGKNPGFFVLVIASMAIFEAYGFIAVPDVPLLFFTISFFFLYKRYLGEDTITSALLLGLTIALLLYSKYHGLLVIFFTILSNLSLFKRKSFYLVFISAVILYLPHLIWQVKHDYPSYQYHILNKSQTPYDPLDTVNYILGLILIAGPFTGFFLYYAFFRKKAADKFERGLKFTFFGFVIFFLLSSINARVEPNWLLVCMIPLLVLAYPYILERDKMRKWLSGFAVFSCLIFLFARLNLMFNFLPGFGSEAMSEFYGGKEWAACIQETAGNAPVVFCNSYQKAAKYEFYSRQACMSLNSVHYRRNQYDFWKVEDNLQGKRVMYIPNWDPALPGEKIIKTKTETLYGIFIDNFRSYTKILITTGNNSYKVKKGEIRQIPILVANNYPEPVTFGLNDNYPDSLGYCFYKEEEYDHEKMLTGLKDFTLGSTFKMTAPVKFPDTEGVYYLRFVIHSGWLPSLINSRMMRVVVEI